MAASRCGRAAAEWITRITLRNPVVAVVFPASAARLYRTFDDRSEDQSTRLRDRHLPYSESQADVVRRHQNSHETV